MSEQQETPPEAPPQNPERQEVITDTMTPSVARVLLDSVGNTDRLDPDYQEPVTLTEIQQVSTASVDQLAYIEANAVSDKSRTTYWGEKTREEQEKDWKVAMEAWVNYHLANPGENDSERMRIFRAVGLVSASLTEEAMLPVYTKTVDMFYERYFKDKTDSKRFIEDIAKECRDETGAVDLLQLEKDLEAIPDLLTVFGEDKRADLMIRDFIRAYGQLTHNTKPADGQLTTVAQATYVAAHSVPPEEAQYLRALHEERQKRAAKEEDSPEPPPPPDAPGAAAEETTQKPADIRRGMTVQINDDTFMVRQVQGDRIEGTVYNSQQSPTETSLTSFCNTLDASHPQQPESPLPPENVNNPTGKPFTGDETYKDFVEGMKDRIEDTQQRHKEARDLLGITLPTSIINLINHHQDVPVAELLPIPGNVFEREGKLYTILSYAPDTRIVTFTGPSTRQTITEEEFIEYQQVAAKKEKPQTQSPHDARPHEGRPSRKEELITQFKPLLEKLRARYPDLPLEDGNVGKEILLTDTELAQLENLVQTAQQEIQNNPQIQKIDTLHSQLVDNPKYAVRMFGGNNVQENQRATRVTSVEDELGPHIEVPPEVFRLYTLRGKVRGIQDIINRYRSEVTPARDHTVIHAPTLANRIESFINDYTNEVSK